MKETEQKEILAKISETDGELDSVKKATKAGVMNYLERAKILSKIWKTMKETSAKISEAWKVKNHY